MDIHPPKNNGKTWQRENYGETSSILPTNYGSIMFYLFDSFWGLLEGKTGKSMENRHDQTW